MVLERELLDSPGIMVMLRSGGGGGQTESGLSEQADGADEHRSPGGENHLIEARRPWGS